GPRPARRRQGGRQAGVAAPAAAQGRGRGGRFHGRRRARRNPGADGDPAMTLVPSRRLLVVAVVVSAAAFGVLVFPAARLLLLAVDLFLIGAVAFDAVITPRAGALEVERFASDRMP